MKYKLFSSLLISITLLLLISIGTFNYIIDPYGYNHIFHLNINAKKRVQNERHDKFKLLLEYPQIESFIFGSSRGLRLNPDIITSLTEDETLNMAFCSASADEYYLYIKYLIETRKVKRIVIALDLFAYADGYQSNDTLPESLLTHFHQSNKPRLSSYLNYETLTDSIKTIKINRNPSQSKNDYYTLHGENIRIEYLEATQNKTALKVYTQKNVIDNPPYWNTRKDTLATDRLAQLSEIKKLCNQRGIKLDLFMSPLWIKQITMKQNKFFLQKTLLKYIVQNIQPVWDYNGITAINTDPYAYEDQFHFSCITGESILTEIITGKPSIESYTGTYITQQNITTYLNEVDQRLDTYLKSTH